MNNATIKCIADTCGGIDDLANYLGIAPNTLRCYTAVKVRVKTNCNKYADRILRYGHIYAKRLPPMQAAVLNKHFDYYFRPRTNYEIFANRCAQVAQLAHLQAGKVLYLEYCDGD